MTSTSFNTHTHPPLTDHPLARIPREDLDLIVEFVLASGSLKDLGKAYGVSYPTIRTRLDGLIARLRDAVEGREADPITDLLADLVARGEVAPSAARAIRQAVRDAAAPPTD